MAYSKLEKMIIDMATPVAETLGCYIYDTEFVKEGTMKYLRIYADKEDGGISIDECERINRKMGEILDREDPIKENYVLEVSSPGIERKLKTPQHFEKYNGRQIDLGLYKAVDGSKALSGILKGFKNEMITVETDSGEKTFGLDDVTFVKLHFDF
ncbi:MAG: ribosome maturation factor RimP [Clostridia bacterium]|nr:ribosome maturation factor RimP [Clostridia bacterium]